MKPIKFLNLYSYIGLLSSIQNYKIWFVSITKLHINTMRLVCYDKLVYRMIHRINNNNNNNNKFVNDPLIALQCLLILFNAIKFKISW